MRRVCSDGAADVQKCNAQRNEHSEVQLRTRRYFWGAASSNAYFKWYSCGSEEPTHRSVWGVHCASDIWSCSRPVMSRFFPPKENRFVVQRQWLIHSTNIIFLCLALLDTIRIFCGPINIQVMVEEKPVNGSPRDKLFKGARKGVGKNVCGVPARIEHAIKYLSCAYTAKVTLKRVQGLLSSLFATLRHQ